MKVKWYPLALSFMILPLSSHAQKQAFSVSAYAGLFAGYSDEGSIGPAIELKAAKKISPTSWISLGLGYINLRTTNKPVSNAKITTRLIPFMLGYRKYWNKFYIEPRAGLGELGGKFSIGVDQSRPSVLAFMYTLGTGCTFKKFEMGLELQGGGLGISSSDAGYWYNKRTYYSGIKLGIPLIKIKSEFSN